MMDGRVRGGDLSDRYGRTILQLAIARMIPVAFSSRGARD